MLGIPTQINYANMNNNYNNSNYAINNSNDMQSPLIQSPNISLNNNINTNQNIINTNMTESQPIQYNQPPIQYNQQPIQYQNYSSPNNLDFNFNGENFMGDPLQNPYVQSEIRKVNSQQDLTTRIINVTKTFYPCCPCFRKNKVIK